MALVLTNNASSTLVGSIGTGTTSITLANASKFPVLSAGQWHPVTVTDGAGNLEIMRVTSRSGNVLTVVRGQEGTTAFGFANGASVQLRFTAGAFIEALAGKAEIASPDVTNILRIAGAAPKLILEDTDNAGVGRSYFFELNGDTFTLKRDLNADDDVADAGETTPVFSINGTTSMMETAYGLLSKSIQFQSSVDKSNTALNDLVSSGFYIGNNFTNAPEGSNGRFFVLVQRGTDTTNVMQIAWTHGSAAKMYHRSRVTNTWGAWNLVLATPPVTAPAGKKRIPAFDEAGDFAGNSVTIDLATGASLLNAGSVSAARNVLTMGESDPVAFSRVHSGGSVATYDFSADTTECAYLSSNIVKSSRSDGAALHLQRLGSSGVIAAFYRGAAQVGDISVTGSATSYNTSSDYRLKKDVESLFEFSLDQDQRDWLLPSLLRVMAYRPIRYRWNIDDANAAYTKGYLAHELQAINPDAVTGIKDGTVDIGRGIRPAWTESVTDEDDKTIVVEHPEIVINGMTRSDAAAEGLEFEMTGTRPVFQGVDHSKLVPELNAALQELTVLVLELRAEIALLKG